MSGSDLPGLTLSLLFALLATAFVLVLAWFALKLLARAMTGRTGDMVSADRLRIVQNVPLGGRERAVLLRKGGTDYLLGVSAGGVTLLDRLTVHDTSGPKAAGLPAARDGIERRGGARSPE